MSRFNFLVSDVSIFSVYSPLQMLFFRPIYLQNLDIHRCRCSFLDRYICKTLIFTVADALLATNVSAPCFSLNLQILFTLPVMYNCIYILPFLGFEDTPFANFASTFHIFDNMRILLIEILHPQFALSITCRFRAEIVHPQFSKIYYRRYIRNARPVKFYYLIHQACDNVQAENKWNTFQ